MELEHLEVVKKTLGAYTSHQLLINSVSCLGDSYLLHAEKALIVNIRLDKHHLSCSFQNLKQVAKEHVMNVIVTILETAKHAWKYD